MRTYTAQSTVIGISAAQTRSRSLFLNEPVKTLWWRCPEWMMGKDRRTSSDIDSDVPGDRIHLAKHCPVSSNSGPLSVEDQTKVHSTSSEDTCNPRRTHIIVNLFQEYPHVGESYFLLNLRFDLFLQRHRVSWASA